MRSILLALLLVAPALAFPSATAAAPFLEDPQGDLETRVFGGPSAPVPTPGGEASDLLSLEIAETAEDLIFTIKAQNLQQTAVFSEYGLHFTWDRDEYVVYLNRRVVPGVLEDDSDAFLYKTDDFRWDRIAHLPHTMDLESGRISVELPKAYLIGEKGRYPLLGDTLSKMYVESMSTMTVLNFGAQAYDRMPDAEATVDYPLRFGDVATGKLRLDANERVRVSNGGATTFVYTARIENMGESDEQVALTLTEMPEGWNGTVNSPIRVPAGAERRVAILVSVPFGHEHGGFSSFNLTASSSANPSDRASIRMGVLHTPIPQPAGHHAELYLHAENLNSGIFGDVFPFTGASMNTDADHTNDATEAAPWNGGSLWRIPLAPGLRMGLDFDLERLGTISGSIIGRGPGEATVRAELFLVDKENEFDAEDGIFLGETDAQPITLDLSNPSPFKLTFTPSEDADYIPYAPGQNLIMLLHMERDDGTPWTICCLPGNTPGLVTADFKAALPLNEYHDRLSGLMDSAATLELKADGAIEKTGLPGTTMTYGFTLINHGTEPETIQVDIAGTDALQGTLVPRDAIHLGAKESRKITLAVTIPTTTNEGEELEVLLFAHAQADPSKSAIARTKTIAARTGATAAPDETGVLLAAQQAESNDTPGLGMLGALGALGTVALALGRGRRRG